MKLSELQLDVEAVDNGIWVDSSEFDGVSWYVRGTEYPPYQKALRTKMANMQKGRRTKLNGVAVDEFNHLTRDLMVEHCLLDWRGIDTDDGEPVSYSRELARAFMSDRKYSLLARDIMDAINTVDNTTADTREEVAGN